MLRDRDIEALAAYWGYTLRPLVELLRMCHCPPRWDFGMRYLERDLPQPIYEKLRDLMFVDDPADLEARHAAASDWGIRLLAWLRDNGT